MSIKQHFKSFILITLVPLAYLSNECGNPVIHGGITNFETCNRFGNNSFAILLIITILLFVAALLASLFLLWKLSVKAPLQYDVKWPKDAAYCYYFEANKIYNPDLAPTDNNSCLVHIATVSENSNIPWLENIYVDNVAILGSSQLPNNMPIHLPYIHARLRTYNYAITINIIWTCVNCVIATLTLIADKRSGVYWMYIGIIFCIITVLHIAMLLYTIYETIPKLFCSSIRRSIFENYNKLGLGLKYVDNNQNFCIHSIICLDQYETNKGAPSYLTEQEKNIFIRSYNESIKASKLIQDSQRSQFLGAGSSLISALMMFVSSIRNMDVNGTTASINALSLTFAIAAIVQTAESVTYLNSAKFYSESATNGIERVNTFSASPRNNSQTWATNVYKKLNIFEIWYDKETNISLDEIINNHQKTSPYCPASTNEINHNRVRTVNRREVPQNDEQNVYIGNDVEYNIRPRIRSNFSGPMAADSR